MSYVIVDPPYVVGDLLSVINVFYSFFPTQFLRPADFIEISSHDVALTSKEALLCQFRVAS